MALSEAEAIVPERGSMSGSDFTANRMNAQPQESEPEPDGANSDLSSAIGSNTLSGDPEFGLEVGNNNGTGTRDESLESLRLQISERAEDITAIVARLRLCVDCCGDFTLLWYRSRRIRSPSVGKDGASEPVAAQAFRDRAAELVLRQSRFTSFFEVAMPAVLVLGYFASTGVGQRKIAQDINLVDALMCLAFDLVQGAEICRGTSHEEAILTQSFCNSLCHLLGILRGISGGENNKALRAHIQDRGREDRGLPLLFRT
jgi:hypothetical protein